jgi:hypothetical protein
MAEGGAINWEDSSHKSENHITGGVVNWNTVEPDTPLFENSGEVYQVPAPEYKPQWFIVDFNPSRLLELQAIIDHTQQPPSAGAKSTPLYDEAFVLEFNGISRREACNWFLKKLVEPESKGLGPKRMPPEDVGLIEQFLLKPDERIPYETKVALERAKENFNSAMKSRWRKWRKQNEQN